MCAHTHTPTSTHRFRWIFYIFYRNYEASAGIFVRRDSDAQRYSEVHIALICNKANKVRETNDVAAELHVSNSVGRLLPPEYLLLQSDDRYLANFANFERRILCFVYVYYV